MNKIKGIVSGFFDKHRFIISWTAVLLFFFFSFMHVGWGFALFHSLIVTLSMVIVSLVESRILVKYLLRKGKRLLFYIFNVILIIGSSASFMQMQMSVSDIVQNLMPGIPRPDADVDWMVPFIIRILIYTCVASITAITHLERSEQEMQRQSNELKIENLDMELRYLKSQINPHFLFNALNNIYSLVYIKDEKAPESVLKLSEMLRYVMVDCQADMISIEKEVRFIDNYIDFQLMKHECERNVSFEKNVKNWGFMLPPMIFQPIVENAFKYSRIENDPNGFIRFSLKQDENILEFTAENSIKSNAVINTKTKHNNGTGIGLQNVKKRLSLHYKEKFYFTTKAENNIFKVIVEIIN